MRGSVVTIDARDLARIVATEVDHVGVEELADWIIAGRSDYRLVDLRGAAEFASYHIPTAENVPLAALPDYPFGRQEKIVLYSDGGIHSAQAWFLLQAKGYRGVYILRGGLDEWKDTVLFPRLAENPSPADRPANEKRTYMSRHFGGRPLSAGHPGGGDARGAAQGRDAGGVSCGSAGEEEAERRLLTPPPAGPQDASLVGSVLLLVDLAALSDRCRGASCRARGGTRGMDPAPGGGRRWTVINPVIATRWSTSSPDISSSSTRYSAG
jgi:rhodanese-related sulfurtransferase